MSIDESSQQTPSEQPPELLGEECLEVFLDEEVINDRTYSPASPKSKPKQYLLKGDAKIGAKPIEKKSIVSQWGTVLLLFIGIGLLLMVATKLMSSVLEVMRRTNQVTELQDRPKPTYPAMPVPAPPHQDPAPPQAASPEWEISESEKHRILNSFRTHEDDEERIADIKEGFSIEHFELSDEEARECKEMAEVIERSFSTQSKLTNPDPSRLYHPVMIQRVRDLLPAQLNVHTLYLPTKYMANCSAGVRVVSVEELDDDKLRIVYCHMGDHSYGPFRFTLALNFNTWVVADYEAIDQGLSLTEVMAMRYTLDKIDPAKSQTIDSCFGAFSGLIVPGAHPSEMDRLRTVGIAPIPAPLRDYYRCSGFQLAQANDSRPNAMPLWLDEFENPSRFGILHRGRILLAYQNLDPTAAIKHCEEYMDRFGTACPLIVTQRAECLSFVGRIDDSIFYWRQALTMEPKSQFAITSLARLIILNPELRTRFASILDEFQITQLVEDAIKSQPPLESASPEPM